MLQGSGLECNVFWLLQSMQTDNAAMATYCWLCILCVLIDAVDARLDLQRIFCPVIATCTAACCRALIGKCGGVCDTFKFCLHCASLTHLHRAAGRRLHLSSWPWEPASTLTSRTS